MSQKFLVSIIIPTFNRAHLIAKTLDSVAEQTYTNWECIVVDDGSIDQTDTILDVYIERDCRFQYYQRPKDSPKGANACRNYGLSIAKGAFIKFLDSDDLIYMNALENQFNFLNENSNLDMVCGYARYFKHNTNQFWDRIPEAIDSLDPLTDFVLGKLYLPTAGPLWRTYFLKNQQIVFDTSRHRLQDTEFHYRMLLLQVSFKFLKFPVVLYRYQNPDSITMNDDWHNLDSIYCYWEQVLQTYVHEDKKNQRTIKRIVANKLSILTHKMIGIGVGLRGRRRNLKRIKPRLEKVFTIVNISYINKFKIRLGYISTLLTGRGLKFFRIPIK